MPLGFFADIFVDIKAKKARPHKGRTFLVIKLV